MRIKLLGVLVAVTAIAFMAPASADEIIYCNPDPYLCAGVEQYQGDDWAATFLFVDSTEGDLFAGYEYDNSWGYAAAGACADALAIDLGCAILISIEDDLYLYTESPTGCMMIPLNGGSENWC